MIYTIPYYKLKSLTGKIESLNRRVSSMKGTTVEYKISLAYEKLVDGKLIDVVDIDVINPVVSLNGWSFLGSVEHSKDGNIILKKIYDVQIPEQYLNSDDYCEHCNTKRYRKFTYLVYKAETGEIHQIGSTCLKAYLGFDVSLLLEHFKLMDTITNMMGYEGERIAKRGIEAQPFDEFIKRTIVHIDEYGYVSAKKAREHNTIEKNIIDGNFLSATGDTVFASFNNMRKIVPFETEEVVNKYNAIVEWVNGLENNSDYIHNIKTLMKRGYVTFKTATTAASIVGVWYANTHKKKIEDKIISNHFGTIKERMVVDVTVEHISFFEGQYGAGKCYKFRTNEGNVAVWFSAKADLELGKRYVGKATVTKHTEFKGVKQTQLNRCSLELVD